MNTSQPLSQLAVQAQSHTDLWCRFINAAGIQVMVEVGVYKGDFAVQVLQNCPALTHYYMIDPWRHLDDWHKPANEKDAVFEQLYTEAMNRTAFAAEKRIVLRGKTTDVIDQIPDNALDFAYIDGDHTLKGVTIDLIRLFPKIRPGGWLGGDDFSPTIWQHRTDYEPTLVFPFALYFAEAVGSPLYALPYNQFLIEKRPGQSFTFTDFTGLYGDINLKNHFNTGKLLKLKLAELPSMPKKYLKQLKNALSE